VKQYKVLIAKIIEVEATSEEDACSEAYQAMQNDMEVHEFEFETVEWG